MYIWFISRNSYISPADKNLRGAQQLSLRQSRNQTFTKSSILIVISAQFVFISRLTPPVSSNFFSVLSSNEFSSGISVSVKLLFLPCTTQILSVGAAFPSTAQLNRLGHSPHALYGFQCNLTFTSYNRALGNAVAKYYLNIPLTIEMHTCICVQYKQTYRKLQKASHEILNTF